MLIRILILALLMTTAVPASAQGAEAGDAVKSFAVSPFTVHGPDKYTYLSQGIQSMLSTRLTWPGKLEPVDAAKLRQAGTVDSAAKATQALASVGADYLVWGSSTIVGDNVSLDVHVQGASGEAWAGQNSMPLGDLIPGLEKLAGQVNSGLFKRPAEASATPAGKGPAGPQNPYLQRAQDDQGALNPTFRYEGSNPNSDGRWRSRALPIAATAMTLADLDGNKRPYLVMSDASVLKVMQYSNGDLRDVTQMDLPGHAQMLQLSAVDVDNDGREDIVCSAWRNEEPYSFIVSMKGNKLVEIGEGFRYHLRAERLPPDFHKALLGQPKGPQDIFMRGDVRRMSLSGGELTPSTRVVLPNDVTLFGFSYLPSKEGTKLVAVGKNERLYVYSQDGQQLSASEESFNGTAIGLAVDDATVPGMGQERKANRDDFSQFIPMPLVVGDLEGNGVYEVLANRNLTVAGQMFARYRNYTQGEIQALFWDGVGLQLQWKTERLKGSVVGYDVADLRGDGNKVLVVGVNADTGGVGLARGRTIILVYDLNMAAATAAPASASKQ